MSKQISNNPLVNCLCIGAPKCGTTWLYQNLKNHPKIGVCKVKEPFFFMADTLYSKGIAWYEALFPKDKPVNMEFSATYFADSKALRRIYKYNSKMKLIIMLRDPVERMYSNHKMQVANAYPSAMFNIRFRQNYLSLIASLYGYNLLRWLRLFPKNQICFVLQEEILQDPEQALSKVQDFLGINKLFSKEQLYKKVNVSGKYPFFRWPLFILGFCSRYFWFRGNYFVFYIIQKISGHIRKIGFINLEKKVPLSTEDRLILQEYFAEDVLFLAKLIQRKSLPWATWKYAQKNARQKTR